MGRTAFVPGNPMFYCFSFLQPTGCLCVVTANHCILRTIVRVSLVSFIEILSAFSDDSSCDTRRRISFLVG